MANRTFNQFQGSLEKGVVQLFAEISFGALGVPTLVRGKGIASVENTGTGSLSVYLQDTYQRVLGVAATWKGTSAPAAPILLVADDSSALASPAPYVDINSRNAAGVLADPAEGESLLLSITLSNSTAL